MNAIRQVRTYEVCLVIERDKGCVLGPTQQVNVLFRTRPKSYLDMGRVLINMTRNYPHIVILVTRSEKPANV